MSSTSSTSTASYGNTYGMDTSGVDNYQNPDFSTSYDTDHPDKTKFAEMMKDVETEADHNLSSGDSKTVDAQAQALSSKILNEGGSQGHMTSDQIKQALSDFNSLDAKAQPNSSGEFSSGLSTSADSEALGLEQAVRGTLGNQ